ncbi:MAG: hypothetical protein JWQ71_864 [Pedosphaera sp.]|nr:hypothetical protein [Pedosphaera sp.]
MRASMPPTPPPLLTSGLMIHNHQQLNLFGFCFIEVDVVLMRNLKSPVRRDFDTPYLCQRDSSVRVPVPIGTFRWYSLRDK